MYFFRDDRVTDFCSCKIGIPYIHVHKNRDVTTKRLALLPWMACMQALQEQKPVTKKLHP